MSLKIPEGTILCFNTIEQAWKFDRKYISWYRGTGHNFDNILKVNGENIINKAGILYDDGGKLFREWIDKRKKIYWKNLSYDL